MYMKIKE